jgi:integrase
LLLSRTRLPRSHISDAILRASQANDGCRDFSHNLINGTLLDLDDELLRIPGHIQKDYPTDGSPGASTISLDPEGDLRTVRTLRSYLSTREDSSAALFPSQKSDRLLGKSINDVVQRLASRAEVRPYTHAGREDSEAVSAHTLRHSVAYRFLHSYDGYTLYDVRNRLRHRRLATTEEKYDHFDAV